MVATMSPMARATKIAVSMAWNAQNWPMGWKVTTSAEAVSARSGGDDPVAGEVVPHLRYIGPEGDVLEYTCLCRHEASHVPPASRAVGFRGSRRRSSPSREHSAGDRAGEDTERQREERVSEHDDSVHVEEDVGEPLARRLHHWRDPPCEHRRHRSRSLPVRRGRRARSSLPPSEAARRPVSTRGGGSRVRSHERRGEPPRTCRRASAGSTAAVRRK